MKLSERINNLKLKKLNYYAFLLHLISGIAVVAGILFGATDEINFNTTLIWI